MLDRLRRFDRVVNQGLLGREQHGCAGQALLRVSV
jgi:hypothetical protein